MSVIDKLNYLNQTKGLIKTGLNQFGASITDNDTFRSYVTKINNIYTNWPKVTGENTSLSLNPTKKAKMVVDLKGNSSQESTTGKNKMVTSLDIIKSRNTGGTWNGNVYTFNGVTFTVNDDLSVTIGGTYSTRAYMYICQQNFELSPASYTLTGCPSGGSGSTYLIGGDLREGSTYVSSFNDTGSGTTKDLSSYTNPKLDFYIDIRTSNAIGKTFYPMIRLSSVTDDSYEPYTGGVPAPNPSYPFPIKVVTGNNNLVISNSDNTQSQTFPLSLGSIELCKIGDYQDYIYKSGDNWYKREYIGKVVLNGSESWGASSTYTNETIYSLYLVLSNYKNNSQFISDLFTYQNINPSTTTEYIATGGDSIRIGILKSRLNAYTVNDFESWLSTHNTTVYYQLAQYTDVPITDTTLIEQLNNIYNNAYSYNGTTNITTTYANGNEQMIIEAEALMKGGN